MQLQAAARSIGAETLMPAVEQLPRHAENVGAVLVAGEAVDHDGQRPAGFWRRRSVEHGKQRVAGAVAQGKRQGLAGMGRQAGTRRAQTVGQSLKIGSPPGKPRLEGWQIEAHASIKAYSVRLRSARRNM